MLRKKRTNLTLGGVWILAVRRWQLTMKATDEVLCIIRISIHYTNPIFLFIWHPLHYVHYSWMVVWSLFCSVVTWRPTYWHRDMLAAAARFIMHYRRPTLMACWKLLPMGPDRHVYALNSLFVMVLRFSGQVASSISGTWMPSRHQFKLHIAYAQPRGKCTALNVGFRRIEDKWAVCLHIVERLMGLFRRMIQIDSCGSCHHWVSSRLNPCPQIL
jgi:hypothetical protein